MSARLATNDEAAALVTAQIEDATAKLQAIAAEIEEVRAAAVDKAREMGQLRFRLDQLVGDGTRIGQEIATLIAQVKP